jgi:hypothetical protein
MLYWIVYGVRRCGTVRTISDGNAERELPDGSGFGYPGLRTWKERSTIPLWSLNVAGKPPPVRSKKIPEPTRSKVFGRSEYAIETRGAKLFVSEM